MAAPRKMTARTLNALKGWPQQAAVDFSARLDPTALDVTTQTAVPPGAVVHVSPTTGQFLLGVGTLIRMPLFTFNGSDDPDVLNDGGDPSDPDEGVGAFIAINPGTSDVTDTQIGGALMALVAIGAYELVSTNYDKTILDYAPNDLLTSPIADGGGVLAGALTRGTFKTDTIVGVVSQGVVDNGYGSNAISFWPWFMPADQA